MRQSDAGQENFTGPIAQRLGGLRQVATGTVAAADVTGTIAQRLGGFRQSGGTDVDPPYWSNDGKKQGGFYERDDGSALIITRPWNWPPGS